MLAGAEVRAQQSLETFYRMTGPAITRLFEPQREVIQECSAVIYDGRDEIAYGVVLSGDGYILSKASEVEKAGELSARVDREEYGEVDVVAVNRLWDVILLKVEAEGLVAANFAPDSGLERGTWVVVNGATSRTRRRVLAGVISANAREIPASGGTVLGVALEEMNDGKLKVGEVTEGGGAEEAGIKAGDFIEEVDGEKVGKVEELTNLLAEKDAGARVEVTVRRREEVLKLNVRLTARGELFKKMDRNDMMSGDFSERRSGFPRVIQHDILGNSATMGGPVLDMEGRVVGMNIARANRAETFAIPVEELRELAEEMVARARGDGENR